MSKIKMLFGLAALGLASLACVTIMGGNVPEEGFDPIFEVPVEQLACPNITQRIQDVNLGITAEEVEEDEQADFAGRDEDNGIYIASYLVSGEDLTDVQIEEVPTDLQDEQDDTASHERIWDYYTALIPADYRDTLSEFWIMTDGVDNVLAAVSQTYDDPALWSLEVDIADSYDYDYLTFTLIHEFAHLLTLGPDQVPPSEAIFNNPEDNDIYLQELSACSNFFPGEGCANPDSYINEFHGAFWAGIHDEWNEINLEEDDDVYYERLDDFYYKYEDQFLTDYAVTHPAEDIAESFAFFVISDQPAGATIAEQKILFFYQYPELVDLRNEIVNNVCQSYPQ
jgi:hypothetical protein